MQIHDKDGNRQTIKDFISQYEQVSLIRYFKKANYRNYSSKAFGDMKYLNGEMKKDVKNYLIKSDSIIKISSDPKLDKYTVEKPEECLKCGEMVHPYKKNTYASCCSGNHDYDFYTIGYSGKIIDSFIERLKGKNVSYLIDVRKDPYGSKRKPDCNKERRKESLENKGIVYIRKPQLGVDKEHRDNLARAKHYENFGKWYDENVLDKNKIDMEKDLRDYMTKGKTAFM